jgi:transposase
LNDEFMEREDKAGSGRKKRLRWSVEEKRRIVESSLQPGLSVAGVALAEGINANRLFTWRREYRRGLWSDSDDTSTPLLPVIVTSGSPDAGSQPIGEVSPAPSKLVGSIHIDFLAGASITVEHGADSSLLRTILTTLASNDHLQGNPALESLRR